MDTRNISSSSEDANNTSDEYINKESLSPEIINASLGLISSNSIGRSPSGGRRQDDRRDKQSRDDVREHCGGEDRPAKQISPEDQVEKLIRQAERGK